MSDAENTAASDEAVREAGSTARRVVGNVGEGIVQIAIFLDITSHSSFRFPAHRHCLQVPRSDVLVFLVKSTN
jgi:hypothetical protein